MTEETVEQYKLTEHWFVFVNDPISVMYMDNDAGSVNPVKFVKGDYARKYWNSDEQEMLKELRNAYPDKWAERYFHKNEIRALLFELFAGDDAYLQMLAPKDEETPKAVLDEVFNTFISGYMAQGDAYRQAIYNYRKEHNIGAEQPFTAAQQAELSGKLKEMERMKGNVKEEGKGTTRMGEGPAKTAGPSEKVARESTERLNEDIRQGADDSKFSLMERMDERQILDYMEGRLVSEYFYEYDLGGKTIVGLSFAGTVQAAKVVSADKMRETGGKGIEVLSDVRIEETTTAYSAFVRATDHSTGFTSLGFADIQKKRYSKEKRQMVDDPFALRSVVSKAQRNALRQHIPEKKILELYREWKQAQGRKAIK